MAQALFWDVLSYIQSKHPDFGDIAETQSYGKYGWHCWHMY
ncbi:MAG: hypothetical protein ACYSU4_13270 [Planctomycetota bacterium]